MISLGQYYLQGNHLFVTSFHCSSTEHYPILEAAKEVIYIVITEHFVNDTVKVKVK